MRAITGENDNGRQAASAKTMGRFGREIMTQKENLRSLSDINGKWVNRAMNKAPYQQIILDRDSSESRVYTVSRRDRPIMVISDVPVFILCFASISLGIVKERCFGLAMFTVPIVGKGLLKAIVHRYKHKKIRRCFRGDATFAKPKEFYNYLELNGFCIPYGFLQMKYSIRKFSIGLHARFGILKKCGWYDYCLY